MKRLRFVSLAVILALCLSVVPLPSQTAMAGGVFNVPSNYLTIQAGIDAAFIAGGGTVLVAANTTYNENIQLESGVNVVSDRTGDAIISSTSIYPVVTANEVTNAKLDGFTITNGSGSGTQLGAGVSIQANSSNVTISNCVITGNTADLRGGGIAIDNSSANIVNCTIIGNTANTIAGHGGTGGGIYISNSSPIIINCIIANNTALNAGGGIFVSTDSPPVSSPTVTNCTLTGNSATDGGGMYNLSSNPTITNSIIYGNTATGSGPNIFDSNSTPGITYSCIGGGYPGTGNIDADPLFENPGAGNYHLQVGPPLSPCIDAGDNNAPNLPDTDKDGNARIINGTVDMGAYEVGVPPFDAHAIKSEAIAKLESAKTGDKKIDKKIDKAIKNIEKSLEAKLWTDTSHPDPKDGEKVFTEEKKAVIELMKIKNNSTVFNAITLLLKVDKTLAQIAIADAAGGDAKRIAKAQEEMTKAQEQIYEGHYDKAIEHYKKAWKHAQKAMK